ncbi:MAG: hypothetical protein ABR968_03015 [Bacteroidales bacterium]|jgi:hypothetical protein
MIKITVASHTIKKTAHKEVADLVVKVNDILYYEYESFDSVGMHAEYHISDLSVLIIYQEKTKYHYPERLIKGMPGADSGKGVFYFKALKTGNTTLTIIHNIRRKIERESIYNIIVE